jgi:glycosyltransferase involved in cell wall biosynthesis
LKVAHLCLSCFYNDGRSYQENELVRQHVIDGHDVLVIASTERISPTGELTYSEPCDYSGTDGARVIRVPYRLWPAKLARKLRVHADVYGLLDTFRPDVILFHGCCGWEVATAARYAIDHPDVLFYIDSHEDRHNSARTWLSRQLLHKLYYRFCLARAWPHARKILCVSLETRDFVAQTYRVPRDRLEFYPLGGRIVPDDEYAARRGIERARLGIGDGEILLVQSGKQSRRKKLLEALRAFRAAAPANARLKIAGTLADDIRDEASRMIAEDARVEFLGWKDATGLTDLLCAADVYLQPGTQSVTMQHSLCCRCAVIIDDVPSHKVYVDCNGWLIGDRTPLEAALAGIAKADLPLMQERSFAIASRMLDYAKLANRVLSREPLNS